MRQDIISQVLLLLALSFLLMMSFVSISNANDSAAEISASGIQFKEEKNISIEKEELIISTSKIVVTYEFRNNSEKEITTEIAFPIPRYSFEYNRGIPNFDEFTVEVNGEKIDYNTEVRALVHGKDYSKVLRKMGITIDDFGGWTEPLYKEFYKTLSRRNQQTLKKYGIVDSEGRAEWTVSIIYHWTQNFPPNSSTVISHTYSPWLGYSYFGNDELEKKSSFLFRDACITNETGEWMKRTLTNERPIFVYIVGYILTTANNWRTPIKDFKLIIEKKAKEHIGVCFNNKLIKISETQYESHIENFVPNSNLKIYFFH